MSLAEQQNALLSAIFKSGEQTFTRDNERGLAIYQRNLLANAVRALSITYPGVNKLLGAEDFKRLCELYLQRLGKRQYDWGVWGAELPQLLLDFEQPVCDQLLLSELAVFEWFIHSIERSSDTDRDLATLSLLATDDSYNIKLNLAPGIQLYSSHFLLDSLKLQLDGESSNKLVELEYNGDNEVSTYSCSGARCIKQATCALNHGSIDG